MFGRLGADPDRPRRRRPTGVALVARGLAADPNRVPWGNMYEFTLSGTFVVAAFYLLLYRRFALAWMAPIVLALVLTLLMTAVIWLYAPVAPLTEALYSPWLVIHVVSAILATGAFTLAGICSVLFLVKERSARKATGYLARVPEPVVLDRVSYRLHAFAFPVWTFAVLITGPIWAHQAWSSYWNWDPKEVWAFITWVVYAAYLHARSTAGWKGRNAAIVALVGLATLWFNFIGINFFSSTSQHSYAEGAAVVEAPAPDGSRLPDPASASEPGPGPALVAGHVRHDVQPRGHERRGVVAVVDLGDEACRPRARRWRRPARHDAACAASCGGPGRAGRRAPPTPRRRGRSWCTRPRRGLRRAGPCVPACARPCRRPRAPRAASAGCP